MVGQKKKHSLGELHSTVNKLRCMDARMKMTMVQHIFDAVKRRKVITEVTPKLLGISLPSDSSESTFSKLRAQSKRGIHITPKKYFNEKSIMANYTKLNITYMNAREILMENYLEKHKIPNKRSLMLDFESRSIPCDENNFDLHLKARGFVLAKLPYTDKSIIIEDPKRVIERHRYFKQIEEYRDAGRTIVYIEENNFAIQNGMFLNLEPAALSSTKWYLIVATEGALLKTFTYTYSVTCDYKAGLNDMILPVLPKNSVVVIEEKLNWENDAPLSIPTDTTSKKDMKTFLDKNGVPYDENMNKAELVLLVNTFTRDQGRRLDVYLKGLGHEVLRRQKGFPSLRLTAPIEKYIKNKYMNQRGLLAMDVGTELTEIVKGVTQDQWKEMASRLRAEEKRVYEEDVLMDDVIDKLVALAADSDVNNLDLDDFEHDCGYYFIDIPFQKSKAATSSLVGARVSDMTLT